MLLARTGIIATPAGATGAFESIATVTASGGESSLDFTSIPSTYASLQIRAFVNTNYTGSGGSNFNLRFNDVSTNSYAVHYLMGYGSVDAGASVSRNNLFLHGFVPGTNFSSTFGVAIIDVHDYSSTSRNKTVRSFTGYDANTEGNVGLISGLFNSTSAITKITFAAAQTFVSGSTIALYGVKS